MRKARRAAASVIAASIALFLSGTRADSASGTVAARPRPPGRVQLSVGALGSEGEARIDAPAGFSTEIVPREPEPLRNEPPRESAPLAVGENKELQAVTAPTPPPVEAEVKDPNAEASAQAGTAVAERLGLSDEGGDLLTTVARGGEGVETPLQLLFSGMRRQGGDHEAVSVSVADARGALQAPAADPVPYGPFIEDFFSSILPRAHSRGETDLKRHINDPKNDVHRSAQVPVTVQMDDFIDAHVALLALIAEFYPEGRILSMHRDFLYADFLLERLAEGDPALKARLGRVLLSRTNTTDLDYKGGPLSAQVPVLGHLRGQGLSLAELNAGAQAVLPDTGFRGSIPRYLWGLLPPHLRGQLQAHYIHYAGTGDPIPSSEFFTAVLRQAIARDTGMTHASPGDMIGIYEGVPVPTGGSYAIELRDGRWEPTAAPNAAELPQVRAWLEHIASRVEGARSAFQGVRPLLKELRNVIELQDEGELAEALRGMLAQAVDPRQRGLAEALMRDVLEFNRMRWGIPRGRGLSAETVSRPASEAESAALAHRRSLRRLAAAADRRGFEAALAAARQSRDPQAFVQLSRALRRWPAAAGEDARELAAALARETPAESLLDLAQAFSSPAAASWGGALATLLTRVPETGSAALLETLASQVFSRPWHADKEGLILNLIARTGALPRPERAAVLERLAGGIFSRPHGTEMAGVRSALEASGLPGVFLTLAHFDAARRGAYLARAVEAIQNEGQDKPYVLALLGDPALLADSNLLQGLVRKMVLLDAIFPAQRLLVAGDDLRAVLRSVFSQPQFSEPASGWPRFYREIEEIIENPDSRAAAIRSHAAPSAEPASWGATIKAALRRGWAALGGWRFF